MSYFFPSFWAFLLSSYQLHLYWFPVCIFMPSRDWSWNDLCSCISSFRIFFQILNRMAPTEAINSRRNNATTIKPKRFCSNVVESNICLSLGRTKSGRKMIIQLSKNWFSVRKFVVKYGCVWYQMKALGFAIHMIHDSTMFDQTSRFGIEPFLFAVLFS